MCMCYCSYDILNIITIIIIHLPAGLVALSCQDNADDVLFSVGKEKAIRRNGILCKYTCGWWPKELDKV